MSFAVLPNVCWEIDGGKTSTERGENGGGLFKSLGLETKTL